MKKALIIATIAVAVVGGSALAYKAYARYDNWGHGRWHGRMSTGDMTAFADARIAALKAGLALSAEQEKLWTPLESTLRDLAKKRIDRRAERQEQFRSERQDRRDRAEPRELPNPVERLRRGAERMSEGGADLKRLADVADPLYQSLDEAQKRRFNVLARAGMRGMHQEGRGWRRHGDLGDEGRHMGPRGDRPRGWQQRIEFQQAPEAERL
jgi:hypothetical protein